MRKSCFRHWLCWSVAAALASGANIVTATAEGTSGPLLPPTSTAETPAPSNPPSVSRPHKPAPRISAPRVVRAKLQHSRAPAPRPATPAIARAFPPPPGESRFEPGELLVAFVAGAADRSIDLVLRRRRLTQVEVVPIGLLGITFRLLRITDGRAAGNVVRELGAEPLVASAQPNYVYAPQEDAAAASPADPGAPQYALEKLHVDGARAPVAGEKVLVAVVDTAIDEAHPDLVGSVAARFDAVVEEAFPRAHGTAIAGAIAAHGRIRGVAPQAGILSARAFETVGAGPQGATLAILRAIDWAAQAHARIINMSFAGPPDPAMHRILAAAFGKGIMLIAAAGNAGPNSAPLYPAADESVLAVTATDADDNLFENANVGRYVALAAPGVDVLLPAPGGKYELATGTSIAAALVSGVAALVLERHPAMQPAALRRLLTSTATPLGGAGRANEFGAGLVDAQRALAEDAAAR